MGCRGLGARVPGSSRRLSFLSAPITGLELELVAEVGSRGPSLLCPTSGEGSFVRGTGFLIHVRRSREPWPGRRETWDHAFLLGNRTSEGFGILGPFMYFLNSSSGSYSGDPAGNKSLLSGSAHLLCVGQDGEMQ